MWQQIFSLITSVLVLHADRERKQRPECGCIILKVKVWTLGVDAFGMWPEMAAKIHCWGLDLSKISQLNRCSSSTHFPFDWVLEQFSLIWVVCQNESGSQWRGAGHSSGSVAQSRALPPTPPRPPFSRSPSAALQLYSVFCVSLCRLSCTFTSMDPSGSRPSSMWPSKFRRSTFSAEGLYFCSGSKCWRQGVPGRGSVFGAGPSPNTDMLGISCWRVGAFLKQE